MFFLNAIWCFPVLVSFWTLQHGIVASDLPSRSNTTTIVFQHISQCKRNEFYDLDYFKCVACGTESDYLQPTEDKFACECTSNSITIAFYDTMKNQPICMPSNTNCSLNATISPSEHNCPAAATHNTTQCTYKAVNYTLNGDSSMRTANNARPIRITHSSGAENCHTCNLLYNFHYNGYCIGNALVKPYLKYNSFWLSSSHGNEHHFSALKFVAFFCLSLHNNSACQQLANLCVMSHFSLDKNSPCSAFLLTQATDVAIKYGSMDDHLQAIRPFLFYKKGKQTAKLLAEPVLAMNRKWHQLQIFHTIHALDGTLQRWGHFKLQQLDFCRLHAFDTVAQLHAQQDIDFAQYYAPSECWLTLENLIDLARLYANNNFISLYLNVSGVERTKGNVQLQAIPILIEDLTAENVRAQPEDWQLVKRFQMIQTQHRHIGSAHLPPAYEATNKLLLYRTITYVEHLQLHYQIQNSNRISIPIVKLRYRKLELSANATLDTVLPFKLRVTFARVGETAQRTVLFETLLPMLLLLALAMALLRLYNYRKRRPLLSTANVSTTTAPELCGVSACLLEFLLQLLSNVANAFLVCFMLYVVYHALQFLTQQTVQLTLPLMKGDRWILELLLYAGSLLKLIFLILHFRRITHFDMFLMDWERPRSYENNHFNLKNNLETSSVCSSVRTFASESNVSAWRVFFAANEWIRLSVKQQHSVLVQGLCVLVTFELITADSIIKQDITLQLFVIVLASTAIYMAQRCCYLLLLKRLYGDPLQKFIDLCSLANISVFILLEPSYGFYIHGRSPSGFADTDMYSMIMQLQRESQQRCSRKGLLGDSDQQSYIMLPPTNLRTYYGKLLASFQRSCSISQAHFQKELNSIDAAVERHSAAYSSMNRFLCAFIDHAIKDMDYIIKEKTFIEKFCKCEFDNYMTEHKGTFYIDSAHSFGQLFLYGNDLHMFVMELLLLLALYMLTMNLLGATVAVCLLNALLQCSFLKCVRQNVTQKTSIDRRFLM